MKIIAAAPKIAPFQYKCGCGTTLEAEESDIQRHHVPKWDQREGSYNVTEYFTQCPVCDDKHKIDPPRDWINLHKDLPYS